jgi:hypothetical protein
MLEFYLCVIHIFNIKIYSFVNLIYEWDPQTDGDVLNSHLTYFSGHRRRNTACSWRTTDRILGSNIETMHIALILAKLFINKLISWDCGFFNDRRRKVVLKQLFGTLVALKQPFGQGDLNNTFKGSTTIFLVVFCRGGMYVSRIIGHILLTIVNFSHVSIEWDRFS